MGVAHEATSNMPKYWFYPIFKKFNQAFELFLLKSFLMNLITTM